MNKIGTRISHIKRVKYQLLYSSIHCLLYHIKLRKFFALNFDPIRILTQSYHTTILYQAKAIFGSQF